MKTKHSSSVEHAIREVPSGEYMCAAQLAFFRFRLEDERRMLLDSAKGTLEQMQAIVSESDSNDRASMEEKFSLEFRVRDRERKLLKKIEDALLSIEDGTYGWCVETGEPIGIARLLARSTASLCLEAQERHERYERSYRI
ncbi:transcriptional regulator, TraR/DksA family [Nitrosospira sp. Nsp11]|uniref:RNA polymerase-binding protein DksA n=1 Tax=Nitrosospira sp. Nsp11 TaxID=1855338 RepID=UPI00091E64EF|nr:RNA polymerase-binding protein DksA [Nitrosospira sp. Nsp11]SHL73049.1 transcriptional regulator, TraR/DksA family [Nitrosospira sp. Nsp11]